MDTRSSSPSVSTSRLNALLSSGSLSNESIDPEVSSKKVRLLGPSSFLSISGVFTRMNAICLPLWKGDGPTSVYTAKGAPSGSSGVS